MTKHLLRAALAVLLACAPGWAQTNARYTLSADGAAQLNVAGMGTASITVSGTYSGTVNFEVIGEPGTAAVTIDCATPAAPGTAVNSTSSTGVWTCPVAGLSLLQARMSDYASGTAVVYLQAAPGGGGSGGGGGGGSATANLTLQETDDGSIAAGQSADAVIALPYMYNGSAQVRMVGDASNGLDVDVTRIQGNVTVTASNLDVQSGGADLATEATLTNMLTSANFAAAFGTAGSADSQVMSVQGVGSMTPLLVNPGTGTNFGIQAEDAVAGSGFNGIPSLAVRQDSQSDLAADGDFIPLTVDGDGGLRVSIVAGAGSGGTALADDADFTAGTTSFTPAGGFYQSSVTACTDGDTCAVGITAQRTMKVTLFSAAGTELTQDTQATHATTLGTITSVTGGVLMGNASTATPTDVGADGDAAALWLTRNGALNVADAGGSLTVDGTVTVTDGSGALNVIADSGTITTLSQLGGIAVPVEDAAETAGGTGVYAMGVRRDTAASSAGTSGDNTMASYDSLGRLWSRTGDPCSDHARLSTAAISTTTNGNVEVVALNGSDLIYVCGVSIVETAAQSVQLIYGTGTACATGETDLTGPYALAANGGFLFPNAGVPHFIVPAGNAFCIETNGTGQTSGHVTYVRTATP